MKFGGQYGIPAFQAVRLPEANLRPAPLTIMDAAGRVVRVVAPEQFSEWRKEAPRRCRYHDTLNCPKCLRRVPANYRHHAPRRKA